MLDFFWLAGDAFEEVRREVPVAPRRVLVGVLLAMSALFVKSSAVIARHYLLRRCTDHVPLGRPDQSTMRDEIASNGTTTNLLGGMFDTLAHHPEQYDMIRANPDLIPMAIEEQLRITTPIQNLYRSTRADYQAGDATIPNGSRILLSFGAANRDPLAFDNPDEYRADRNPRTHVAFGYGAHMCLGAPLTRMEAQAVLRELVTHVSRISATGQTIWSSHSSLRGPTHLPTNPPHASLTGEATSRPRELDVN